jgi:hypothetical protein
MEAVVRVAVEHHQLLRQERLELRIQVAVAVVEAMTA